MSTDAGSMSRNTLLIKARKQAGLSQEGLALRIQAEGRRQGEPNGCTPGTVNRWEHGGTPQPRYILLLESALGQPAENLGFAYVTHEMDRDQMIAEGGLDVAAPVPDPSQYSYGPMTGIWLSQYRYHSDSRDADFFGRHHVLILQRGAHLDIRSLPKQSSRLSVDLTVNGKMAKGNWVEHTSEDGYYKGSVYDGAMQLELNQDQTRMVGIWVGFGRNPGEINTDEWKFSKRTERIDPEAMSEWDHEDWDAA